MTPDRVREIRIALGLSQSGLAEMLRLGPNGARTIRRWESGQIPISGPASVAITLLEQMHLLRKATGVADVGFAEDD